MRFSARHLDQKIRAVCPIDGVSVDSWSDRATWRVIYRNATDAQKAAAQAIVDTFDPTSVVQESATIEDQIDEMKAVLARQQAFIDALQQEAAKKLGT